MQDRISDKLRQQSLEIKALETHEEVIKHLKETMPTKGNNKKDKPSLIEKCTDKKSKTAIFSSHLNYIGATFKQVDSARACGNYLEMYANKDFTERKIKTANFCKIRLCPYCEWRKASKDALKHNITMKYLAQEHNQNFLFGTFTIPNIKADSLSAAISLLQSSFTKLIKRKLFINSINGYICKLEVTYQNEKFITAELYKRKKKYYQDRGLEIGDPEPNYDTYHPHLHVVMSVDKSYCKKKYISKEKWKKEWIAVTKDDRITQVDIRPVTVKNEDTAFMEISKYSAKDSDYLGNGEKVFAVFYKALKGRQLVTYGGNFAKANIKYKAKELEHYKDEDKTKYVYLLSLLWSNKGQEYINSPYHKEPIRLLTEEEMRYINGLTIDMVDI